jgi:hypothetical protein
MVSAMRMSSPTFPVTPIAHFWSKHLFSASRARYAA